MDARVFIDKWVAAYNDGDIDRLFSLFTDDYVYECPNIGNRLVGDESRPLSEAILAMLPDRKIDVRRVVADGDAAAVEYVLSATSLGMPGYPPAGESWSSNVIGLMTFRGGKLAAYKEWLDAPLHVEGLT